MSSIDVGATAPDFSLKAQDGQTYRLSDYRGKRNVVLAFYPLDFSPVCTREASCFMNDLPQFNHLDAQVLGISVDHEWAHKVFAERQRIQYPLLADFQPRGEVARLYGVFVEEKGHSARATFIVDKEGKIAFAKVIAQPEQRNNEDLLAALRKLEEREGSRVVARFDLR